MSVVDNLYMTYSYLVLARLINILNSHLNTTKYMMNQNLFCYALVLAIIIERKRRCLTKEYVLHVFILFKQ